MKRVLALYYSQTDQLGLALRSFLAGLEDQHGQDGEDFEVHVERLRPRNDYPFPWSMPEFLDVFPESVLGVGTELETPGFDPDAEYDLIVLGYTVWYLAPSIPIQSFLQSKYAQRTIFYTNINSSTNIIGKSHSGFAEGRIVLYQGLVFNLSSFSFHMDDYI